MAPSPTVITRLADAEKGDVVLVTLRSKYVNETVHLAEVAHRYGPHDQLRWVRPFCHVEPTRAQSEGRPNGVNQQKSARIAKKEGISLDT